MCGIAGLVHKTGKHVTQGELDSLTDLVAHRGPDGRGTYRDENVGLGHRRLAILDLSEFGLQPMRTANDDLVLTYNGEIYNYIELRADLTELGHHFKTGTDSEVILAAYREWGDECVRRFNGMWAFAILDRLRHRIFISRDRFGVKPIYYCNQNSIFAFGSEIRQLLPYLSQRRTDLDRVRSFLITGGLDLDNKTFFEGIEKLPAGSSAVYDLSKATLQLKPHYRVEIDARYAKLNEAEALEVFRDLLADAVRLRMRSDVVVGTCLSGGLDSSAIATLASALNGGCPGGFTAITAISEDPATDETPFAEQVVRNSDLNWKRIKPDYRAFADSLEDIVRVQQEPFGSPSLTMQYFVMKAARENGIKVLLDGQAGDETLMGYEKYYYAYLAQSWRDSGWAGVFAGVQSIRRANAKLGYAGILKYVLGARHASLRYNVSRRQQPFVNSSARPPAHLTQFADAISDPFKLQELEIRSTNLPILLRYEDLNSMAHGVEARLPFLDYRLVELSLSMPVRFKMRDGWTKWILRQAMSGKMPDAVTWRRNKYSFDAPDRIWLSEHLKEMKAAVQKSPVLAAITNRDNPSDEFERLGLRSQWRLYNVALWERAFGISS